MRPFRRELKFVVHHSIRSMLLQRWGRYLTKAPFTNKYAVSPILSQYYDSPTLEFHQEKLDGIDLRHKVRLRTYDYYYRDGATAFLEVKQRCFDSVRKFRQRIHNFHRGMIDPRAWVLENQEHQGILGFFLERYNLRPSAQIFYLREAYEGLVESDLRVTFDSCLTGLFPGETFSMDLVKDRSRSLMSDTLAILEVKSTGQIPDWVYDGVIAAELQQQTIPKYCTAIEELGMDKINGIGVYA